MNTAHVFGLQTDAQKKIAAVEDPATRAALEAILKIALLYPNSQNRGMFGGA